MNLFLITVVQKFCCRKLLFLIAYFLSLFFFFFANVVFTNDGLFYCLFHQARSATHQKKKNSFKKKNDQGSYSAIRNEQHQETDAWMWCYE